MTPQRMLEAAQILGELGNGKMANELTRLAERYCWRPISEIHEDCGPCVVMHINDPGNIELTSNLCPEFDESDWTHFSQIVPLTNAQAEEMRAEMERIAGQATGGVQ